VATLRETSFFFTKIWVLDGWYTAEPNSWSCPNVGGDGISQLVFRLTDNDGERGVIQYDFDTSGGGGYAVEKICVKNDRMEYSSKTVNFLPPCLDGFTAVPVSLAVRAYGDATLNLTVRPTPRDYARIMTYFGENKNFPSVINNPDGTISPACGYQWISSTSPRTELKPGFIATQTEVRPAEGYRWLNYTNTKDCSVEPIPTTKLKVKKNKPKKMRKKAG
jgi:hypothetical protein